VFLNLMNNAAKYTKHGGQILLIATREGSDAVVSIRDNGIGIPGDMLSTIFDMFLQVDGSLEQSKGGLGIGLTLVSRLVEMHGGSIEARSNGLNEGSEFVVRLPLVIASPLATAPGSTDTVTRSRSRCRILVVDDNRDAADTLAILLRVEGNDIRTAYDGPEAVEVAEMFHPDVVLLDIGLPKLNGYDVARRIRQQPWGHGATLIALTGWGKDEDRRLSQEAGFNFHLVKPVDLSALEDLLNGVQTTVV